MDFFHGDGNFGGDRTMSNLLNELGDQHRHRNMAGLSISPVLSATLNSNPLKQCRSVSDMDLKSRDERDGPMKLARTDSFPFSQTDLKMHSMSNTAGPPALVRTNSMLSDGRLGYSPTNSSASDGALFSNDARLDSVVSAPAYADSSARTAMPYHQAYPFRPAVLSMGRDQAMNNMGMHVPAGSRLPFTQSQWQELEHQALIFKYMMAGVPVPSDLLMPIRKCVGELTGLSAGSHHPNLGWSSFHLRFANNTDPEPGRCRRTDGKKWRCSRDVAPDQKYCERHMHRGRPRSRKPVEGQTSANATHPPQSSSGGVPASSSSTAAISSARNITTTALSNLPPSISINAAQQNQSGMKTLFGSPSVTGCLSVNGISNAAQFKLPLQMVSATSAMANKDHRYMNWMKGDMDEQIFFSDANSANNTSNNSRGLSQDSQTMSSLAMLSSVNNAWRLMPSKVPAEPKINNSNNSSLLQYNSPQLRTLLGQDFGLMTDTNRASMTMAQPQQQQPHSFLSDSSEGQPLRHFFDDWPRSRDPSALSWSEMEDRSNGNSSTTQLSISIPTDFSGTNSNSPRGKLSLSSLKLSMSRAGEDDPLGVDPTQMGLGLGINEDGPHRQTANWIPVTWQSPVGGPLAEVLQSSTAAGTPRSCKNSGLNLMSDGWDLSPRDGSRMASPTGVLQKTFASLSDSSSGSSPRAVAAAAAAAKPDSSLQQAL